MRRLLQGRAADGHHAQLLRPRRRVPGGDRRRAGGLGARLQRHPLRADRPGPALGLVPGPQGAAGSSACAGRRLLAPLARLRGVSRARAERAAAAAAAAGRAGCRHAGGPDAAGVHALDGQACGGGRPACLPPCLPSPLPAFPPACLPACLPCMACVPAAPPGCGLPRHARSRVALRQRHWCCCGPGAGQHHRRDVRLCLCRLHRGAGGSRRQGRPAVPHQPLP
jgi:hypothetical protein